MTLRFCRDCTNFEDRRDIDSIALCARNAGPYVCCEEFEPRDEYVNEHRLYSRFCSECANFEDVDGTAVCGRNHTPGVACEEFIDRFEELSLIRQSNHMQAALIAQAIKSRSNPKPIPDLIIEIGRKIKW